MARQHSLRASSQGAAWRSVSAWQVREDRAPYVARARPKLYLETTIASYLAARPSGDTQNWRNQAVTRLWWERHRPDFDVYVSSRVIDEVASGHPQAALRRLALVAELPALVDTEASGALARALMKHCALPTQARVDAEHVAIAATHEMKYLLTWNCSHLANEHSAKHMAKVCESMGWGCPTICTPLQLIDLRTREVRDER